MTSSRPNHFRTPRRSPSAVGPAGRGAGVSTYPTTCGRPAPTGSSRGAVRVLLVDDDPVTTLLVKTLMDLDERFEATWSASSAAAAIALATAETPDAIVLDLAMPGELDGWSALPILRRLAPDAAIVIFSAFPDPISLGQVLLAGADQYLDKQAAWELLPTLAVLCGARRISE